MLKVYVLLSLYQLYRSEDRPVKVHKIVSLPFLYAGSHMLKRKKIFRGTKKKETLIFFLFSLFQGFSRALLDEKYRRVTNVDHIHHIYHISIVHTSCKYLNRRKRQLCKYTKCTKAQVSSWYICVRKQRLIYRCFSALEGQGSDSLSLLG